MVVSKYPKVIEQRRQQIYTNIPDPGEADEESVVDDYGSALNEEDESDFGDTGGITDLPESET